MKTFGRVLYDFYTSLWDRFILLLQRRTLLTFLALTFIVVFVTSILLRFAEKDQSTSLWRASVYIMSGIDVDPPNTTAGRLVAAGIVLSGVILVSLLTGYVASEFSRAVQSSQSIRMKPRNRVFENHVIMFGWGPKRKEVLRQLNADWQERGLWADDIVIISEEEFLDRGSESIYSSVWHVRGSPTDIDVLRAANLTNEHGAGARVAVIMGNFGIAADQNDRASLLQLLAVEHLHPEVISLAEVQQDSNYEHFKNANADEIITPNRYMTMVLARTAEYRGIASYVDELLALAPFLDAAPDGRNADPISFYVRTVEDLELSGFSIADAVLSHYARRNSVLAGVIDQTEVTLFADLDPGRVLSPEENIILIARPSEL